MKDLKQYIVEGSWGYYPMDGDYPLDMEGEMNLDICRAIYDKCHFLVYEHTVSGDYDHKGDYCWCAIALTEWYFDRACTLWEIPHNPKARAGSDKYYYWWKLAQKEGKNIVELYHDALGFCQADEKWISSWKEPKKMQASLKRREEVLKKYQKLYDAYVEKQRKSDEQKAKAEAEVIASGNAKLLAYGKNGWEAIPNEEIGAQGQGQIEEPNKKNKKKK